jgi:ankyrin repeat protein
VIILGAADPKAIAVVTAIRSGDIDGLRTQLAADPELATACIGDKDTAETSRSLLHVVADWPGHFPRGAEAVAVLVAAGADVNARFRGPHEETPLHWAASSNDVAVLDALLDAGADIEARGAVIAGGTALADATAFAQWDTARRLVERGAEANLFEAAAVGLLDRVAELLAAPDPPAPERISDAFWAACHGGQTRTAQLLLDSGAALDWLPAWEELTPLDAAIRSEAAETITWLSGLGAREAEALRNP